MPLHSHSQLDRNLLTSLGSLVHDLAQHNSMAASSHDGKKKAAVADDGSIVNTMTKMKYPRIGKKDREGQILETG